MEQFLSNETYLQMKQDCERTCFKLIGKYCIDTGDKRVEKSALEINEYFKNKKITIDFEETTSTKKGSCTIKK